MTRHDKDAEIERLRADLKYLRREIRTMQLSLEQKNKELDALHYVWCNGGCETGTHRWTEQNITEDIVKTAEVQARRLRTWFENAKAKRRRWGIF